MRIDRLLPALIPLVVLFLVGCEEKSKSTTGPESEHWVLTYVGAGEGSIINIAVGDGDANGSLDLYASDNAYSVYQFEWTGSGWDREEIGSCENRINDVAVGDGDGDGVAEVYVATHDFHLYQFKWNGSSWEKTDVGSGRGVMAAVAVGDGNGDGVPEVYGGSGDNYIYQFIWSDTEWVKSPVDSLGLSVDGVSVIEVGDGNGNGLAEVYGAYTDGSLYQFTWSGSEWTVTDVGYGGALAIGDGDGDGASEPYACSHRAYVQDDVYCTDYYISKFIWTGSRWGIEEFLGTITRQAPSIPPFPSYNDVSIGDANGDGSPEIYGANEDGCVYQIKWNGASWIKTAVSSELEALSGIDMGDADGDGLEEVFCLPAGGRRIYQLEVD